VRPMVSGAKGEEEEVPRVPAQFRWSVASGSAGRDHSGSRPQALMRVSLWLATVRTDVTVVY
jgi:hypothetical protein